MLPRKILKFYSRRDVFSCILKLQTMTFNIQKKITFLDNLQASKRSNHKEVSSPLGLFSTGSPLVEAEK